MGGITRMGGIPATPPGLENQFPLGPQCRPSTGLSLRQLRPHSLLSPGQLQSISDACRPRGGS